jgi:hypothetical protein
MEADHRAVRVFTPERDMFQITGEIEDIGELEEGHGFIVRAGEVTVRVTGLKPQYVRELGPYLYSNVSVLIDTSAKGKRGE